MIVANVEGDELLMNICMKVKKTKSGKDYLSVYYSGPIRSAGGTGAAFSLVILDHLREIFGFEKYSS